MNTLSLLGFSTSVMALIWAVLMVAREIRLLREATVEIALARRKDLPREIRLLRETVVDIATEQQK